MNFLLSVIKSGNPKINIIKLVIGAVLISFSGVYVKLANVTPGIAAFYRVLFGGIVLLIIVVIRRRFKWYGFSYLLLGLICGLIFALDLIAWHTSIKYIGPGLATLMGNFEVFILALAGILFFKEKLNWNFLSSLPLAFIGLFLILGFKWESFSDNYKIGLWLGILTAFCYAAFLLVLKKLQKRRDGSGTIFNLMMVCFATAMFAGLDAFRTGSSFAIPDVQTLTYLMAYGLISQAAGWILITNALLHVRTSLAGLILMIQPALSFVWDVLFFSRETSIVSWTGVFITLSAIYIGTVSSQKNSG